MWTNQGLVTTRPTGFFDTVLEYYNGSLTLQDSLILPGDPMELLYDQGAFYIVSGHPVFGLLITAYSPSDQGAIVRNTVAPVPYIGDVVDDSMSDSNGDGIVDSTDLEYTNLKNAAQGKWETPCTAVRGSNGSVYTVHGLSISDPEVWSVLTFYRDSGCQTYLNSFLNRSHALHRSVTTYVDITSSLSGFPAMELSFDTTDVLNDAPFPIHFPRDQIYAIEDSIIYFGTVGLTNVESLKLDFGTPFHKVASFRDESLFATIEQEILTGYSTSSDTDRDGVVTRDDEFPNDPHEFKDSDRDGIGDNADPDDDNDGIIDLEDPNPFAP